MDFLNPKAIEEIRRRVEQDRWIQMQDRLGRLGIRTSLRPKWVEVAPGMWHRVPGEWELIELDELDMNFGGLCPTCYEGVDDEPENTQHTGEASEVQAGEDG